MLPPQWRAFTPRAEELAPSEREDTEDTESQQATEALTLIKDADALVAADDRELALYFGAIAKPALFMRRLRPLSPARTYGDVIKRVVVLE